MGLNTLKYQSHIILQRYHPTCAVTKDLPGFHLMNFDRDAKSTLLHLVNQWLRLRGSTIGEGGDTMISSPGRSPKQPLPGIGLHDPQHGWQACPEFITFDQGVGQIFPR